MAAEVKRITGGKGVAVAYDGVGASTFEASRASLAPRGLLVSFGNASGKVPAVDVFKLVGVIRRCLRGAAFVGEVDGGIVQVWRVEAGAPFCGLWLACCAFLLAGFGRVLWGICGLGWCAGLR